MRLNRRELALRGYHDKVRVLVLDVREYLLCFFDKFRGKSGKKLVDIFDRVSLLQIGIARRNLEILKRLFKRMRLLNIKNKYLIVFHANK
jgi:hypothetical protein